MTKVTRESLSQRISELESSPRSLKEDFQLEAYKMLSTAMSSGVVGYTSQRAIDYEVWNSGSSVFTNKPEGGDVALMVAPEYVISYYEQ